MTAQPKPTPPPIDVRTAALLEELLAVHGPRLWRIAASFAGADNADDAVQSACLGFLSSFDPDQMYGGLAGALRYLATATENAAAKIARGDRRRLRGLPPAAHIVDGRDPLELAQSDADVEGVVLRREEAEEAKRLLKGLPADQRAVLIGRAAGLEPEELQEALGLTPRQYRKRVEKANRTLRAE
jgi:RNA polymerase sigma factor (sigma-70 family)